ncbi:MAG: MFS transporter [candidate division NC10 bacterium]|nr:MFS transporter [candidate division NC10 bacterium]
MGGAQGSPAPTLTQQAGESAAGRRLGQNVVALGVVSLLTDTSTEMVTPLLPLFLTTVLGAGPAFLGLVEGAAESAASLLRLLAGWWSDRLGRRKGLTLAGYSLSSATRPILALAAAPWHVLVVRLVDRVGKGIRGPPRDALLAAAAGAGRRGLVFGFHRSMDHAGAVLGPLLATGLLAALATDLRTVFWLATIPALASVTVLALAVREEPDGPSGTEQAPAGPSGPLTSDARLPRFLLLVVLFTLGNSSDAFLLLKAQQTGVPVALLPILWAALHVVKALASLPGGALSDRWGRGRVLGLGWLLYAAVYAGFAFASSAAAMWGLTLTYGLYFGLTEGVERALIADFSPPAWRATASSAPGWPSRPGRDAPWRRRRSSPWRCGLPAGPRTGCEPVAPRRGRIGPG